MRPKVYLSHVSEDQQIADMVARALTRSDLSNRLGRIRLHAGTTILSEMRSNIEASDVVILLISPTALESSHLQLEYLVSKELRQRGVTLIPFKIKPCRIPDFLVTKLSIDATLDLQRSVDKLKDSVHSALQVRLDGLDGYLVEPLVRDLLKAYGFKDVKDSQHSHRYGQDFIVESEHPAPFGRKETSEWLVEVKWKQDRTSISVLNKLIEKINHGSLGGIFITTGQITSPARKWIEETEKAGKLKILLIDGQELKELILGKPKLVKKYFSSAGRPHHDDRS